MTPNLAAALVAAMRDAEAVGKDATNSFHRYKYASAEAIISEAREALSKNGLTLMPVRLDDASSRAGGEPRRVNITYSLVHSSGESMDINTSVPVCPEKGKPEDKAEFGARTECLAYTLRDLLLLPRVNEEDLPSARDDRPEPKRVSSHGHDRAEAAGTIEPPKASVKSAPAPTTGKSASPPSEPPPSPPKGFVAAEDKTRKRAVDAVLKITGPDRAKVNQYLSHFSGRKIATSLELTEAEATKVAEAAEAGESLP